MVEDYKKYLCYLRNNLIQNNVEFPLYPLEGYRDLLILGNQLDSILYYYSILAVSGSENALNYCIPLDSYYKKLMRQEFYSDWLKYQNQYHMISRAYLMSGGIADSEEDDSDEEIELFSSPEVKVESESNLFGNEEDDEDDSWDDFFSNDDLESNDKYTEHGVYLEELDTEEDASLVDSIDVGKYAEHGTYIEDIESSRLPERVSANSEKDEDKDINAWLEDSNEDMPEVSEEAEEDIEENISAWLNEEDTSEPEDIEEEDDINAWLEDSDNSSEESEENEDEDISAWLNDTPQESSDSSEEDTEDVDIDSWLEDDSSNNNDSVDNKEPSKSKPEAYRPYDPKDLSDYIQDVTNSILTKGRDLLKNKK